MPNKDKGVFKDPRDTGGKKRGVGGSQGEAESKGSDGIQKDSSDCESLAVSIQQKLDTTPSLSQMSQRRPCIYRVPKLLRQVKEEARTPVLVSIGPFHYKNESLLPQDTHKSIYFDCFIKESETRGVHLNSYSKIIKDNESQIRECYAEHIDMPSEEFNQMILIDSIFVIEILRTGKVVMPFTKGEILHDLSLTENQLPFFILRDLYRAAFIPDDMSRTTAMSFTYIACDFFEVGRSRVQVDPITNEAVASSCCHLLDLLRSHHLPSSSSAHKVCVDDKDKPSIIPLRQTATRLGKAGLQFCVKDRNTNQYGLLDIDFDSKGKILRIPKLLVEDGTESLFRNLIAFELCHYPSDCYIVHYQFFLNRLINTEEDVQLLSKAGIIHNRLGTDKKVADLFNSLLTNVDWDKSRYHYANIADQLNKHCNQS